MAADFAGPESPLFDEPHSDSDAIAKVAFVGKQVRTGSVILGVIAHPELVPAHSANVSLRERIAGLPALMGHAV